MTTQSGHTQAIRAKKVIGTPVRDSNGDDVGKVEDIVLDKLSNSILFAVVGFGGVLGMGEKYHPVPWAVLDYDESKDCYVINVSRDKLESAPADTIEALTRKDGAGYRQQTYDYYGVQRDWR